MSQENVEIVRRFLEAAIRQPPDWGTVNALGAAEHVLVELPDFVDRADEDAGTGAAGWRRWLERMNRAGNWLVTLDEFRATPDGDVVVGARIELIGDRSGVPAEQALGLVTSVRNGKVIRTRTFGSWQEALKAVDLAE
jgi:ketosteroid isomerase-like protein